MLGKQGYIKIADTGMFIFFFILTLFFLFVGFSVFYDDSTDVRKEEAVILHDKLVEAILEGGKIREEVLEDFNIFDEAGISKEVIGNGEFYFGVEIFESEKIVKKFVEGNRDFEVTCELKGRKFPLCYEREILIDNLWKIKILTASNQLGQKF